MRKILIISQGFYYFNPISIGFYPSLSLKVVRLLLRRIEAGECVRVEDWGRIGEFCGCGGREAERPRKGKVVKSEPEGSLCVVESIEELNNVGPIEAKQGRQVSTRRTRSLKDKEDSSGCGNGCQEIENPAQIVVKMTRGGMRRKKNLGAEPMECVVNEVLAEKEDVKESNLEREDYKMIEENLMNGEMEAVQAEEREDKDVEERGQTGDENLAASLLNKESGVELRLEMGLTWRRCPSGSGSIIWRYICQNRYMRRLRR
ncbi:hypothetical protein Acr_03g0017450 [Actinidia rufa]|uniref:Uncharacterized protein n=1 Tax=Actinidia rufa TaxID=165716 RepID=A0A7J0EER3_9ERIC|nr:hypothetical protein Acr_03g0017450 [Actinidia rufa]